MKTKKHTGSERLTQPSPYQGRIVAGLSEAELERAIEITEAYWDEWSMLYDEKKRRSQVIKQQRRKAAPVTEKPKLQLIYSK